MRGTPPRTGRSRDTLALIFPSATAALLLLAAEVLQRLHALPVFIPAPSQLVVAIIARPGLVIQNVVPTAVKAAEGYLAAIMATFCAAALAALVSRLSGVVYNLGVILSAIPIIALAPLLALWLGTGPSLQIVIAALSSQFPMLVGMMQGMAAADERQRELFHILSASPLQSFRYLLVPGALPFVFAGLKIAAPSAVLGTVTAEWAGADRGIGAMMLYALFSYDIVTVWLSVLLTCLLASGAYAICAMIERRLVFWASGEQLA
ncbi:NitT/TauT family transport system permease protein [Arboricoccus pini]|uniref:NitT/TauT family transport system permease protein n=1 Tax=Arboricoccus pini TaxID=1963835 RepID=A0A212RYA3_9PROT|nr:ABC transporter permease subunit [Arboricoccus pini]SNB77733.1 NitT/TauT family transport system permease protein [Arboricoccus pini]